MVESRVPTAPWVTQTTRARFHSWRQTRAAHTGPRISTMGIRDREQGICRVAAAKVILRTVEGQGRLAHRLTCLGARAPMLCSTGETGRAKQLERN